MGVGGDILRPSRHRTGIGKSVRSSGRFWFKTQVASLFRSSGPGTICSVNTSQLAPSRRDRKKAATASALRDAALQLVIEHGFENVTVQDITEAADVALRTFYDHYSSKEDAVLPSTEEIATSVREVLRKRPPNEDPLTAAAHAVLTRVDSHHGDSLRLIQRVVANNPSLETAMLSRHAALERALAMGLRERMSADEDALYCDLLAAAAVAALRVGGLHSGRLGSTLPETVTAAIGMLRAGL